MLHLLTVLAILAQVSARFQELASRVCVRVTEAVILLAVCIDQLEVGYEILTRFVLFRTRFLLELKISIDTYYTFLLILFYSNLPV